MSNGSGQDSGEESMADDIAGLYKVPENIHSVTMYIFVHFLLVKPHCSNTYKCSIIWLASQEKRFVNFTFHW